MGSMLQSFIKKKRNSIKDNLLEAVKFRFNTEHDYRKKFLARNGITTFPNKVETNMDYLRNELRDMRKILNNTNESINKMKIISLRIETEKQKKYKKLKNSLGI